MRKAIAFGVGVLLSIGAVWAEARGWTQGKGWGWIWGPSDEVGALNAVTSPASVLRALREVKTGKVFDLGVRVDQTSFKWPGHSPTQIMTYRSPEGVKRGKDIPAFGNAKGGLAAEKMDVDPGDVVLIRTGTLRYWGDTGADHARLSEHDSAGLTLEGAKWLVEQKGAVLIGADTSGLEVGEDPALPGATIPV